VARTRAALAAANHPTDAAQIEAHRLNAQKPDY
jgi:hypothetical protein